MNHHLFRQRTRRGGGKTQEEKEKTKEAQPKKKTQASIQQEPDSTNAPTAALPVSTTPALPAGGDKVAKSAANARAEVVKWATRALEKGINGLREEFMGE